MSPTSTPTPPAATGLLRRLARGFAAVVARLSGEVAAKDAVQPAPAVRDEDFERRLFERTAELREQKVRAEAASRAKSEFLAMMSHEIRTPMNGVLGLTELLMQTHLSERQYRLAHSCHDSAETLLSVINDVLDYARIEAGNLRPDEENFDLLSLLEDTLDMFAAEARSKSIELIPDFPSVLPRMVCADPVRLRQVLVNLVGNAIKFTEHGMIRLGAAVVVRGEDDWMLQFSVSDTGCGIDPERQAGIFDAFVQLDSPAARIGGSGLGLAIAREIVRVLGGGIELESEAGKGSTFRFTMPARRSAQLPRESREANAFLGARALVVDDNAACRDILCERLAGWGMLTEAAGDAEQALGCARGAATRGQPFGVMLIDSQMQGHDGMALAEALRGERSIPQCPLILLGAGDADAERSRGGNRHVDYFLGKPVRQQQLFNALRSVLEEAGREPQSQERKDTLLPKLSGRVLLVDDNEVNQQVALSMLATLGVQADAVENGREALEVIDRVNYDAVLMDCHMPEMDGFDATTALRATERERDLRRLPVIAFTADIRQEARDRCTAVGMDDFLAKPFRQIQLWQVLARWLPQSKGDAGGGVGAEAPPARAPVDASVFDPAMLDQLRDIGGDEAQELIGSVVGLYVEQAPQMLAELAAALAAGNGEQLYRLAHSFKSSSANVGGVEVAALAADIEKQARAGELGGLDALLERMRQAIPVALGALRDYESSLEVPVAGADAGAVVAPEAEGGDSILLVDDDPVFRGTLRQVLVALGYHVTEAGSGAEGMSLLAGWRGDLVLLDAVMDDMSGFEFCARLRAGEEHANLPVIIVTGLDDLDSVGRAFEAGASDFATKPINHRLLQERIRFVLRSFRMANTLRQQQSQLALAQRVARLGYWKWELETDNFVMSDQLRLMCGIEQEPFANSVESYLGLVHEEDRDRVRMALQRAGEAAEPAAVEYRLQSRSRPAIFVRQELEYRHEAGGRSHILGTVQDVTQQRAAEDHVRKLAYYDSLTGLASRTYFQQRLDSTVRATRRRLEQCALLYLDLDGFKDVNDSLGHDAGDHLLTVVASRLQSVLRETDFAARLGGDEFCLILDNIADDFSAAEVAERCLREIDLPVDLAGYAIRPRVSIGIAIYPRDGQSAQSLLKAADNAMYEAKQSGKHRYAFYNPDMTIAAERRLQLEQRLRAALENDEFGVVYQPQVALATGRMVGCEALIRWMHPDYVQVSPAEYIPALERIGLIGRIGELMMRKSCEQMVRWRALGLPDFHVAVNISALHFREAGIVDSVREVLESTGLKPELLELEITESAIQTTPEHQGILLQLREFGVQIAVDDFGTGYSSLGSLKHLAIDCLKIDRAFVTDLVEDKNDQLLISTIVNLSRGIECRVVAEGVETRAQYDMLKALGCDIAQGYFLSRPIPADQIPAFLARDFSAL